MFELPTKQIINCASNNYAGFSRLEGRAEALIEHTLTRLPFAPGPSALKDAAKAELRQYMGFDACEFMPSGFSSNLLAFRTVRASARAQARPCIFLCDRDCHNSLITGAITNSKGYAATYKFGHNDITDLELKLQAIKQQLLNAYVCVVVEGIYSLEGLSAPIPALLALKRVYNFCLFVDEAHSFLSMGHGGRGSFEHWQDLGYDCPLTDCDIMTCMFSKSAGCTGGMVLTRGGLASHLDQQGQEVYGRGSEQLSTAVLVRLLDILCKPALISWRCAMIRNKGLYAARLLDKAGFRVLSFPGSPVICFSVGSLRQLAKFQRAVHQRGIAVAVAGVPATTLWATRVRMSIFATLTWADLQAALMILIKTGVEHRIAGVKRIDPNAEKLPLDESSKDLEASYVSVDEDLMRLVDSLAPDHPQPTHVGSSNEVIQAACAAVRTYGIGPCSARWFYGSFDSYIALEQRLAQMYPSLIRQVGPCRGKCLSMFCTGGMIAYFKDSYGLW